MTRRRSGYSLIEVICATVVGAAALVPIASMMQGSMQRNQRIRVREAMLTESERLIAQIRVAVNDPAQFAQASSGSMPSGISSSGTRNLFPGERASFAIAISPHDSNRDLIGITVTMTHDTSGMLPVGSNVRLVTEIARPW